MDALMMMMMMMMMMTMIMMIIITRAPGARGAEIDALGHVRVLGLRAIGEPIGEPVGVRRDTGKPTRRLHHRRLCRRRLRRRRLLRRRHCFHVRRRLCFRRLCRRHLYRRHRLVVDRRCVGCERSGRRGAERKVGIHLPKRAWEGRKGQRARGRASAEGRRRREASDEKGAKVIRARAFHLVKGYGLVLVVRGAGGREQFALGGEAPGLVQQPVLVCGDVGDARRALVRRIGRRARACRGRPRR